MNTILKTISQFAGTMPFNYLDRRIQIYDFAVMVLVSIVYYYTVYLAMFEENALMNLPECKNICMLGNAIFMEIGIVSYSINLILLIVRMKRFYPDYYEKMEKIDLALKTSSQDQKKDNEVKIEKRWMIKELLTNAVLAIAFCIAFYIDVSFLKKYFSSSYFVSMSFIFPFFTACLTQGQFISLVHGISKRLLQLNTMFENISEECSPTKTAVEVPKKVISKISREEKTTSEHIMKDLFCIHEKIMSLSVMTNNEFAPQVVPFMTLCFCVTLYGIFIETKVIFVAGGINSFLDYIADTFVIWSVITIFVAYMVLRLCSNAYNDMKRTAMIIHEIMQKKPPFMLGSDLYYNKMKAFTLQYLHWEGYFQFNGCGLFALDYTFIFSSVSAATSYLIVLLQFDMSAILKIEGLSN